jgi:hypothetical protein
VVPEVIHYVISLYCILCESIENDSLMMADNVSRNM